MWFDPATLDPLFYSPAGELALNITRDIWPYAYTGPDPTCLG
jgi:hypothetical protein